jgi:putative phage-type endonuclease
MNTPIENTPIENTPIEDLSIDICESHIVYDLTENDFIEREKIQNFKKMPFYEQKSEEWLIQRNDYLTASTISAALGLSGKAARQSLLINKASNGKTGGFSGNIATHWGNKYESVVNSIYSLRNDVYVHEFGMVTNPKYPILGVSPDGVTLKKLLEIKCPFSRIINGKIKTEYYHQVQMQLLVCDYDECDFLECAIVELREKDFWELYDTYSKNKKTSNDEKGIVIHYIQMDDNEQVQCDTKYIYSPVNLCCDKNKMQNWYSKKLDELHNGNTIYLHTLYWKLDVYNCQLIRRDQLWVEMHYPTLEKFWNEVLYYRNAGTDALTELQSQSKKKSPKNKSAVFDNGNNPKRGECLL